MYLLYCQPPLPSGGRSSLINKIKTYLIFVNFGTPPHYLKKDRGNTLWLYLLSHCFEINFIFCCWFHLSHGEQVSYVSLSVYLKLECNKNGSCVFLCFSETHGFITALNSDSSHLTLRLADGDSGLVCKFLSTVIAKKDWPWEL